MQTLVATYACHNQRGVVLVVALIMLLVMTGIGVTVMSGSTLQERMAGNNRQMAVARLNAEAALRQAEASLAASNFTHEQDIVTNFCSSSENGRYIFARYFYPTIDGVDDVDGMCNQAYPSVFSMDLSRKSSWSGLVADGRDYVIEYIGRVSYNNKKVGKEADISVGAQALSGDPFSFRITAIGYGENDNIYAVLQSVYTTAQGSN